MDLRSRHPSILEQDFLLMDSDDEYRGKWDIISLSLVVNFVPAAADRGRLYNNSQSSDHYANDAISRSNVAEGTPNALLQRSPISCGIVL